MIPIVDKPELFLDIKRSLYAFSFHPKYKENGQVFVFSPTPAEGTPGPSRSRVSRFETGLEYPRRIRPGSERVIIEWPSGGHNGGEAIIGPDGYLYIATGDGSSGSDVNNSGQGLDDLLSVMMRIDVDHPDSGRNYSIPKDNPFVHYPGARPEIWAFGFRNPWRMSFDSETGRLWVGDVGQDLWEMIRVVRKGENYGWSIQEGSHPFHPHKKVGPGAIIPPVVEHHHTECRSITGGYVYHGAKLPELRGAYIYGDYQYGKVWGLRYDGQRVTWHKELVDSAVFIASFAVTRAGDILAVDNTTGFIHALGRTPPNSMTSPFPRKLSETGLFDSVKDRRVAPGVIPYSVNAPYWSDGAHKERYFALPGRTQITDPRSWAYPDGMVAVQTLSLDLEEGNARSRGTGRNPDPRQAGRALDGLHLPVERREDRRGARRAQRDRPRREHQGPRHARRHPADDVAQSPAATSACSATRRGRLRSGPERVADEQGPRLRRRRGQPDPRPRPHRHLQDAAGRLAQVAAPVHRPVRSARGPGRPGPDVSPRQLLDLPRQRRRRQLVYRVGLRDQAGGYQGRSVAVPCKGRSGSLTR